MPLLLLIGETMVFQKQYITLEPSVYCSILRFKNRGPDISNTNAAKGNHFIGSHQMPLHFKTMAGMAL